MWFCVHVELVMTTSTKLPTQLYSFAKSTQYHLFKLPLSPCPAPALRPCVCPSPSSDTAESELSMSVEMVG